MDIGRNLISEDKYELNTVRDPGYRHRYTVALLWDLLTLREGPVCLPLLNGDVSGDLMDGIDKVIKPDELQSVGGYIPDLALLRDSRPVRALTVVVTFPPEPVELARVRQLGVETYLIPAKSSDDMCRIFGSYVDGRCDWAHRYGKDDVPSGGSLLSKRPPNPMFQQQRDDKWMEEFMGHLRGCSPAVRRRFLSMLLGLGRMESLYPVRGENPWAGDLGLEWPAVPLDPTMDDGL